MERRKHKRYPYIAIISHDILSPEAAPAGKMYNFSQTGLYFESKHSFRTGEEVFVEVIDHPQSQAELELLFDVKIIWGRKSKGTLFPHGYGARFNHPLASIKKLLDDSQADIRASGINASDHSKRFDARHSPGRAYQKPMLFNYKNNVCRGLVTNISRGGGIYQYERQDIVGVQNTFGDNQRLAWQESQTQRMGCTTDPASICSQF